MINRMGVGAGCVGGTGDIRGSGFRTSDGVSQLRGCDCKRATDYAQLWQWWWQWQWQASKWLRHTTRTKVPLEPLQLGLQLWMFRNLSMVGCRARRGGIDTSGWGGSSGGLLSLLLLFHAVNVPILEREAHTYIEIDIEV